MTSLVLGSVLIGLALGYWVFPPAFLQWLDGFIGTALGILLLGIGIELGQSKRLFANMRSIGKQMLWVPAAVVIGSVGGSLLVGWMIGLPMNEASAIGAGFGWYSLSGVLLSQIYRVDTGALAFLTNVFRELIAILLIPLLAVHIGKITAIAPGGATTMDVTLPLISKTTDEQTTLIAFLTGAVLTALVPILVPLLIRLGT